MTTSFTMCQQGCHVRLTARKLLMTRTERSAGFLRDFGLYRDFGLTLGSQKLCIARTLPRGGKIVP
jgi:hypothetical protein